MSKANKLKLLPVVLRAIWANAAAKSRGAAWFKLDATQVPEGDDKALIWLQVAQEGLYKGHAAGEFQMDAVMYGEIIRNLHAHPSFKAGPDGKGSARVFPFDWRHASEQSPMTPGAMQAQVAESWGYDLETRTSPEGKLQLWALVELLEPARSLIRAGKIAWTSVVIWPNCIHPVSGENIGWYLSSVAFTNDPFVQGMAPIAASRYYDPYDKPETASEVIERLRRLFGLAEMADLGQVLTQIATLKAAATGAMAAPPGVDLNELVGALRSLFNLRTLASVEEVFAEADKLLQALAQEEEVAESTKRPSALAAGRAAPTNDPTKTPPKEMQTMNPKLLALLTMIAGSLSLTAHTPETIEDALNGELRSRGLDKPGRMATMLDLPKEVTNAFSCQARALAMPGDKAAAEKSTSATDKVKALLGALGVQDVDSACNELLQQMARAKELMAAVPELEQMLEEQMAAEDGEATEDIAAALELRGYDRETAATDPIARDLAEVFAMHRCGGVDLRKESASKMSTKEKIAALRARRSARVAFCERYAPKEEEVAGLQGRHYLTRTLFSQQGPESPGAALGRQGGPGYMHFGAPQGSGGQQGGGRVPFAASGGAQQGGGQRPAQQGGAPGTPAGAGRQEIPAELNLDRYSGNLHQRALSAAQAWSGEAWKTMGADARHAKANEVKQILAAGGHDLTRYMGEAAADVQPVA